MYERYRHSHVTNKSPDTLTYAATYRTIPRLPTNTYIHRRTIHYAKYLPIAACKPSGSKQTNATATLFIPIHISEHKWYNSP